MYAYYQCQKQLSLNFATIFINWNIIIIICIIIMLFVRHVI